MGVAIGEDAASHPTEILECHELVDDTLGGIPILVSYCPLCGTAMVFDRRIGGRTHSFGVSGLLYLSDLLLYERDTQSLWLQIRSEAVSGASLGQRLVLLRSLTMRWSEWRKLHPRTTVLSRDTGHRRPYGRSPYGDYATSDEFLFPLRRTAAITRRRLRSDSESAAGSRGPIPPSSWCARMAFHPESTVFVVGTKRGSSASASESDEAGKCID